MPVAIVARWATCSARATADALRSALAAGGLPRPDTVVLGIAFAAELDAWLDALAAAVAASGAGRDAARDRRRVPHRRRPTHPDAGGPNVLTCRPSRASPRPAGLSTRHRSSASMAEAG